MIQAVIDGAAGADQADRGGGRRPRPGLARVRGLRQPRRPRGGVPVGRQARAGLKACRLWRELRGIGAAASMICLAAALRSSAPTSATILKPTTDFGEPEPFERHPGGATTQKDTLGRNAFSLPAANLSFEERADFFVGNGFFKRAWVAAPSSTQAADGLGPLYNARSCQALPPEGRPRPSAGGSRRQRGLDVPSPVGPAATRRGRGGMSRPLRRERGRRSRPTARSSRISRSRGMCREGRMVIDYEEVPVELAGGEVVQLRRPSYGVADLGYGPMQPDVMLSPRVAQPMIGLGLLEAIPEEQILARADPDDRDGDGISGRPNLVWSEERDRADARPVRLEGGPADARRSRAAARLAGDIGVSNPLAPHPAGDCTEAQTACREAPDGNSPQYEDLEAPARGDGQDPVLRPPPGGAGAARSVRGRRPCAARSCSTRPAAPACHTPKFATGARRGRARRCSIS